MLIVTFEVDAPQLSPGVKERIGMMLEQFGGHVRCVNVTQKGGEQMTMSDWEDNRKLKG